MRRLFLWLVLLMPLAASAGKHDDGDQQCNSTTTVGIVDCVVNETNQWDKKLNEAYKGLISRSETSQQAPLKTAQRLWVKYRDANCGFYAAGEGSISRIDAAECMRAMTKDRTCELQVANQRETGPSAECRAP